MASDINFAFRAVTAFFDLASLRSSSSVNLQTVRPEELSSCCLLFFIMGLTLTSYQIHASAKEDWRRSS